MQIRRIVHGISQLPCVMVAVGPDLQSLVIVSD